MVTRAITPLTSHWIYWAAGLLDGEGCITRSGESVCPVIRCDMTDEGPIVKLRQLFGGGGLSQELPSGKIAWRWVASGSRAVGIMLTLYPLLSVRRQQKIRERLVAWRTSRIPPNGSPVCRHGHVGRHRVTPSGYRYCAECHNAGVRRRRAVAKQVAVADGGCP